ncbi:hypothetical protein A3Q56_04029 [Intoshia linei]|uniref:C2H2-type domain-containing protein n=1 Tax=Intoshia linei TaxID=1819745 RepID=A0A177B1S4_9BILA|nr:hypothetical protein A3Q56_04029 [Intoshia linei]
MRIESKLLQIYSLKYQNLYFDFEQSYVTKLKNKQIPVDGSLSLSDILNLTVGQFIQIFGKYNLSNISMDDAYSYLKTTKLVKCNLIEDCDFTGSLNQNYYNEYCSVTILVFLKKFKSNNKNCIVHHLLSHIIIIFGLIDKSDFDAVIHFKRPIDHFNPDIEDYMNPKIGDSDSSPNDTISDLKLDAIALKEFPSDDMYDMPLYKDFGEFSGAFTNPDDLMDKNKSWDNESICNDLESLDPSKCNVKVLYKSNSINSVPKKRSLKCKIPFNPISDDGNLQIFNGKNCVNIKTKNGIEVFDYYDKQDCDNVKYPPMPQPKQNQFIVSKNDAYVLAEQLKNDFSEENRIKKLAVNYIIEFKNTKGKHDNLYCKICKNRKFTAPSTLLCHYRSHAGIRRFKCTFCCSSFTRQHSLNYHILIHNRVNRFYCAICFKPFRHPTHFKEHILSHKGDDPYKCDDCNAGFRTKFMLKRHIKSKCGTLTEKEPRAQRITQHLVKSKITNMSYPTNTDFNRQYNNVPHNAFNASTNFKEIKPQIQGKFVQPQGYTPAGNLDRCVQNIYKENLQNQNYNYVPENYFNGNPQAINDQYYQGYLNYVQYYKQKSTNNSNAMHKRIECCKNKYQDTKAVAAQTLIQNCISPSEIVEYKTIPKENLRGTLNSPLKTQIVFSVLNSKKKKCVAHRKRINYSKLKGIDPHVTDEQPCKLLHFCRNMNANLFQES